MGDVPALSHQKSNDSDPDQPESVSSITASAADDNLPKKIVVKQIDWQVSDREEIKTFFQKFGPVLTVQKGRQSNKTVAFVIFEDGKDLSRVLQAPSDELIYKNQLLQVEKAKEKDASSECSLNIGDGVCNLSAGEPAPINRIPNELLDYIFTFLDIQERIQSERVCKRWRLLGTDQPWSEPKYLAFDDWRWEKSSVVGKWPLTDKILSAVLYRCGASLRGLKLSNRPSCQVSITGKALELIGKYCPNITEIELILLRLPLSHNCLAKLGEGCKKLNVARLSYDGEKELVLESFLKECEGLESLALSGEKICPKEYDFDVINRNLKVLDLYCYDSLQPEALYKLMQRCESLQEFRLGDMDNYRLVTPEVLLKLVFHYCDTLKVLELSGYTDDMIINWCAALSKLYKLEELHTSSWGKTSFECHSNGNCFDIMSKNIKIFHARGIGNYFDETFVKKLLSRNDNIQELHLLFCCNLSPDFLKLCLKYTDSMRELVLYGGMKSCKANNWCEFFAALRNLETLILGFCSAEVNDEVAQILAKNCRKLKILNVGSTAITDTGLSCIASLPFLTQLNISNLEGITNKGIVVLATQGRLERLNVSKYGISGAGSQITDESCCLLARLCPKFRVLEVENVVNITNNLVAAFYESLQEGYLKQNVTLNVQGTSVTRDCKKHERLVVHM